MERSSSALDDVYGTGVTVRSCCEKRFEKKNFAKVAKILRLSQKYSKTNFAKLVEKSFDFSLCLFVFVKATKFRDSNEFLDCVQNV